MSRQVLLPSLSAGMEEGTLSRWLIREGDTIKSGDVIAEIETDKATMEFEATEDGVVGRLLVSAGTPGVKVNQPIALILASGEKFEAAASSLNRPGFAGGSNSQIGWSHDEPDDKQVLPRGARARGADGA